MLRNVTAARTGKVTFAKHLRKQQTPGEKIVWRKLRAKRFHGFKFRRQVPLGPFVADFLCLERKLIIEIDGDSHFELGAEERDKERDRYLHLHGFRVLRFGNRQAVFETDAVLMHIAEALGIHCD